MGRRYRIAHVITRLELGGAQQNTLFCTRHHDRSRFDVGLVAGQGGLLDDEARAIPDADVRIVPWLEHDISPRRDTIALVRLCALFRSRRLDLVHTHSSKAGIVGRLAAQLAGVPCVVHTAHGWSFNRTQPVVVRHGFAMLERLAAAVTDRLIVVSRHDLDEARALGVGCTRQYALLRSGIDPCETRDSGRSRDAVRTELGVGPDHVLVGTLSCLKPQKGPLDFVGAASLAHARCDRLRFVVAGDGPLRREVEARVRELRLGGVLRLLGWRRDVGELLRAMDVFLLTSRFEGLPRAVLQAMAAGVPVVATAVGGTPEVVEDRCTGLLVPPESPRAAADRVVEMVADSDLRRRCVERARRTVDGRFDIHRMVRDLERIYISLLARTIHEGP